MQLDGEAVRGFPRSRPGPDPVGPRLSRRDALLAGCGTAALAAAAGALAGCGTGGAHSGATPAPSGATETTLAVAIGGMNGGALPIWMADHFGYFGAEGLKVAISNAPHGSEPMGWLNTGKARFITIALDLIIWDLQCCSAAREAGEHADAAYVAAAYDVPVFSVIGAGSIRTMVDLRGKPVFVVGGPESAAHYALRLALQAHGMSTADVRVIAASGSTRDVFQKLKAGQVPATVLPPPMSIRALQQGFHLLADAGTLGKPYPQGWLAVDRRWAAAHRETVVRFLRAYARGLEAAKRNPAAAVQAVGTYGGVGQPEVARLTYRAYAAHFLATPYPPVDAVAAALQQLTLTYPAAAARLRSARPASFIDTQYLQAAGV